MNIHVDSRADHYESMVMDKPYCRATPYLVGILLGYRFYQENGVVRRIPVVRVHSNEIKLNDLLDLFEQSNIFCIDAVKNIKPVEFVSMNC